MGAGLSSSRNRTLPITERPNTADGWVAVLIAIAAIRGFDVSKLDSSIRTDRRSDIIEFDHTFSQALGREIASIAKELQIPFVVEFSAGAFIERSLKSSTTHN